MMDCGTPPIWVVVDLLDLVVEEARLVGRLADDDAHVELLARRR